MGKILEGLDAETQVARFGTTWERYKNNSKLPIFKTLVATYYKEFLVAFSINFLVVICNISIPLLIGRIVSFMEKPRDEDGGIYMGIIYISIYIVASTGANLLNEQAVFRQNILAEKVYSALISTIYNKTLRISPSTNKEFAQGEIINFIQVDAEKT